MRGLALEYAARRNPGVLTGSDPIRVAACVARDGAGRVLLSRRRPDQLSGGCWEIPGGKIEPGEDPARAAARELFEETGLKGEDLRPLTRYRHRFEARSIDLALFEARRWSGSPVGREGQKLDWVCPGAAHVAPILGANLRALRLLGLPRTALCAGPPAGDPADWARALARRANAVSAGAVLFRCRALPAGQQIALGRRLAAELARHGTSLWLDAAPGVAIRTGAALATEPAGTAPAGGSALVRGAIDPDGAAPVEADVVFSRCRQRIPPLAERTGRPVYAISSSGDAAQAMAAGAFGVCIDDGRFPAGT